jgi:putative membrane protein
MTWWCAATRVPWSWSPRAYPGVWAFIALLAVVGVLSVRRTGIQPTGKQKAAFVGGLVSLWIASDWPVGTLGSGYLASAHMLQYFLYTFAAAPLLVLAVPEALARRALAKGRLYRAYRILAKPMLAAILVNVVLIVSHAPVTVDTFRSNQFGSFLLDILWLVGGILLWLPICGPLPEARPSYPIRCVYLFLAAGVMPMVPGGFLTFSDFPLYSIYELAPRVGSIKPIADQQVAGVIMKIGNLPLIWPIIATMMWRWAAEDRAGTVTVARTAQ